MLVLQIESGMWRRKGKAMTNFEQTLPAAQSGLATQILKDPYKFGFLSLSKEHTERELETDLIAHITQFLLELDAGFAYIGRQVPLQVGEREFFLDLLFYHTRLHCHVVVELKTVDFEPEFAGKLNFYIKAVDEQIRYNVFAGEKLVACISFCACAWKLKDRERFIGWSEEQRQRNLQLVVNNARFLVLPWIESKGLASKILALAARELPRHWKHRYGFEPVLLETFVEYERHKGTCYKAANWVNVGRTTGRGKKSISHERLIPSKDIWLYPLRKNFATLLCK